MASSRITVMIAFALRGGMEAGQIRMDHVGLATLAVSLGGVETLVDIRPL